MRLITHQSQSTNNFRAQFWKEFVANYQNVLVRGQEQFYGYCEKFRKRWIEGA